MPVRFGLSLVAASLLALAAAGCVGSPAIGTMLVGDVLTVADEAPPAARGPLPLRVPIRGVMAGLVDFSAFGILKTAMSDGELSDDDWVSTGYAALNIISSATLITSPAPGLHDNEWEADPLWRKLAADMQGGAIGVGIAVRSRDRGALLASANLMADACKSCHDRFKPRAPDAHAFASADH